MHTSMSTTPTLITEVLRRVTTAVLNDCHSEVTAYTALAYSYWASFHDAYSYMLTSRPLPIPTTAAI